MSAGALLLIPAALLVVAAVTLARVAWVLSRELHTREHTADAVAKRPDLIGVECADPIPASLYNGFIAFDGTNGYHPREGHDRA